MLVCNLLTRSRKGNQDEMGYTSETCGESAWWLAVRSENCAKRRVTGGISRSNTNFLLLSL
jgi:hypothetical protein